MSIGVYPKFRTIDINDYAIFDKAFKNDPPSVSEFTFTNLYAWRQAYKITVSLLDGLLVLCSESEGRKRFFNPIGKGDIKAAIERIINDTGGIFFRVTEETGKLFDTDTRFIVRLDANNSDYVYNASDLAGLAGKKYDGKRNLIKKFRSTYEYEYIILNKLSAEECLVFEEEWCFAKDCGGVEGLNNERLAVREMVANFSAFNLIGGAIKTGGKIRAMSIAERLNSDTMVMHVMKANPDMTGLYQTILHEFLSREGRFFEYVNLEQDLGIESIRRSKLSYHPVTMIEKYTIESAERGDI